MIAEVQGIEVLSLSPWMYGVLLLTSVIGLITAAISLWLAFLSLWHGKENGIQIVKLEHHVNSRLTELLVQSAKAAQITGHSEGVEAERQRSEKRESE